MTLTIIEIPPNSIHAWYLVSIKKILHDKLHTPIDAALTTISRTWADSNRPAGKSRVGPSADDHGGCWCRGPSAFAASSTHPRHRLGLGCRTPGDHQVRVLEGQIDWCKAQRGFTSSENPHRVLGPDARHGPCWLGPLPRPPPPASVRGSRETANTGGGRQQCRARSAHCWPCRRLGLRRCSSTCSRPACTP